MIISDIEDLEKALNKYYDNKKNDYVLFIKEDGVWSLMYNVISHDIYMILGQEVNRIYNFVDRLNFKSLKGEDKWALVINIIRVQAEDYYLDKGFWNMRVCK